MSQLMPIPLTVSCFSKIQIGLPFWYRLTWVVPEKEPLNGCVCYCNDTVSYFLPSIQRMKNYTENACTTKVVLHRLIFVCFIYLCFVNEWYINDTFYLKAMVVY